MQLALNVNDLDESIAFYSKLFGAEPARVRPGYANFAIADPPLKLILMENRGQGGSLNHLGVEVSGTDAVEAEQGPPGRSGPGRGGRARHHLLLRPAGQVLGAGRPERGAVGDLCRPGG
jgi:catechol 2,3-dioxygenase-like lactoylglutathione lyase family enzyme